MTPSRAFIVTGGNSGLGYRCAAALAEDDGILVVIACRDLEQGERAARRIRDAGGSAEVLPLDLGSQASIRNFVQAYRSGGFPPLAGLVCNAGVQHVAEPTRTAEGYETTFAVNHLGHYLLSRLLLSDIAAGGSITFVSSGVHDPEQKVMPAPRYGSAEEVAHDFEPGAKAGRRRYSTSKLCNIYCTYEYARRLAESPDPRLRSLRVNAVDPGLMPGTGLARTYSPTLRFVWNYLLPALSLFIRNAHSPAKSGRRLARIAEGGAEPATGAYFSNGRAVRSSAESYDRRNALDLWNASAAMTGLSAEL